MPYKDSAKQRESVRRHYRSHPDYYRNRNKRRLEELLRWYRELKQPLQCAVCGENHISYLEFHHNNPAQKEMTISKCVRNGWSKTRILQEMAKCTILCANCHRKAHWTLPDGAIGSTPDFESGN